MRYLFCGHDEERRLGAGSVEDAFVTEETPDLLKAAAILLRPGVCREGETYGLLFPAYELPAVERLTGLEAPELPPTAQAERRRRSAVEGSPARRELLCPRFCWL